MNVNTQRGKQPTRGRFAPSSQVPPLAFSLRFRFNLRLIELIMKVINDDDDDDDDDERKKH